MTSLAGTWHLIGVDDDELSVPPHRVDVVFRDDGPRLAGAVRSRGDDREIPLAFVELDGQTLRLQMTAMGGGRQADLPTLVMKAVGDRFEGEWVRADGRPAGLQLKLVRARTTP
jgi:hypothetical protein